MNKRTVVDFFIFGIVFTATVSAQKVFSVDYPSQAGWRNKSKKALMY